MPEDVQFHSVSFVSISDEVMARVADRTGRPIGEVRSYLQSDRQDDELLRAFLFFGVGPINKHFQS